jgi:hypothetical protein
VDGNSAAGVGTGDGCAGPTRGGSGFVAVGARACRRSHALLPDFLLARRLDEAVLVAHEVSRARRQALVCPQFILAVSVDRGVPLG